MSGTQVLVVDDDPALLEALPDTLRLRMANVEVDTTDSGPAALARLRETDYDALVVDIKMPGMDGLELLGEIKRTCPGLPTIVITGHGDHDLAVEALRAGAQDYVTKPIDRDYFVGSLNRAIECHKLSLEVAAKRSELQRHTDELEACLQERTVELREANWRLDEMNRQREMFVSLVAHDLAAPLTAIRGYAELLGRSGIGAERQERARKVILSETARLARLAGDLVDATQIVTGQFQIRPTACDAAEIVREQVELARARDDSRTIHLYAPPRLEVICDRDRLAQVVTNLLTNALKYAPGAPIDVHLGREGQNAVLKVNDQGPGVPPEHAEHIFQPGSRLEDEVAAAAAEGRGFGLHIAKGIVESHGGRIWLDSAPGVGARFCVALPVAPVDTAVALEPTAG